MRRLDVVVVVDVADVDLPQIGMARLGLTWLQVGSEIAKRRPKELVASNAN